MDFEISKVYVRSEVGRTLVVNMLNFSRIFFPQLAYLVLLGIFLAAGSCKVRIAKSSANREYPQFAVIADCQYCKVEGTGVRKYSKSGAKLEACVANLNTLDLDYAIHLGDFIDRDWESFEVVVPIYNNLKMLHYHVLGNHDFSVEDEKKDKVVSKMGLPSEYFDFEEKGWRFVILNGNDVSFHAYPENSSEYKFAEEYYAENDITSPRWNGAIGDVQLEWLDSLLERACKGNEKVVIYCHFPVYPENLHNLWNAAEVVETLEKYACVKAFMNGHNHEGNYGYKEGIHYLTFKGMVDTEESSYGVVRVNKNSIFVKGFGREEDRRLKIRR